VCVCEHDGSAQYFLLCCATSLAHTILSLTLALPFDALSATCKQAAVAVVAAAHTVSRQQ
jgi:hypothetical protein